MKNFFVIAGLAALLLIGAVWWSRSMDASDPEVLSTKGLHWHPNLEIYVDGVKQEIPVNIGVGPEYITKPHYDPGMGMSAIHTHTPDGVIHFEFPGKVTQADTTVGQFFEMWGRDFMSFGSSVTMTVNGAESAALENYAMKDGDSVVLRYTP